MLRQASEEKQWSLSQLIRAGAYEKAVNILNARSTAAYPVRNLLERVAKQLFDAKVMISPEPFGGEQEFDPVMLPDVDADLYATSLSREDGKELKEAMRKLGGELAAMFAEELMRVTAAEATAKLLDPSPSSPHVPVVPPTQPELNNSALPSKKPPPNRKQSRQPKTRKER